MILHPPVSFAFPSFSGRLRLLASNDGMVSETSVDESGTSSS